MTESTTKKAPAKEVKPKQPLVLSGKVVSNKMQKTLVVETARYVKHPRYNKYLNITKRYKAHYEEGTYAVGDKVTIQECKPISRDKNFRVVSKA